MPDYRALKVKIGLKDNGHADYPDFNTLSCVQSAGIDWSYYIGRYGLGWMYDAKYGHHEEGADSPVGQQWGVIVTTSDFVTQAVAAFSDTCTEITEADLQEFVDERVTIYLPAEEVNEEEISKLSHQLDLMDKMEKRGKLSNKNRARLSQLEARIDAALDPDDDTPGIRKARRKRWVDIKATENATILT